MADTTARHTRIQYVIDSSSESDSEDSSSDDASAKETYAAMRRMEPSQSLRHATGKSILFDFGLSNDSNSSSSEEEDDDVTPTTADPMEVTPAAKSPVTPGALADSTKTILNSFLKPPSTTIERINDPSWQHIDYDTQHAPALDTNSSSSRDPLAEKAAQLGRFMRPAAATEAPVVDDPLPPAAVHLESVQQFSTRQENVQQARERQIEAMAQDKAIRIPENTLQEIDRERDPLLMELVRTWSNMSVATEVYIRNDIAAPRPAASSAVPTLPLQTRVFLAQFLRAAVPELGERPCMRDDQCVSHRCCEYYREMHPTAEANYVPLAAGSDAARVESRPLASSFPNREYLLQSDLKRVEDALAGSLSHEEAYRGIPSQPCLFCNRVITTIMNDGESMLREQNKQLVVTQNHYNQFDQPGEYNSRTCLLLGDEGTNGLIKPIVEFDCDHYIRHRYPVQLPDGSHRMVDGWLESDEIIFHGGELGGEPRRRDGVPLPETVTLDSADSLHPTPIMEWERAAPEAPRFSGWAVLPTTATLLQQLLPPADWPLVADRLTLAALPAYTTHALGWRGTAAPQHVTNTHFQLAAYHAAGATTSRYYTLLAVRINWAYECQHSLLHAGGGNTSPRRSANQKRRKRKKKKAPAASAAAPGAKKKKKKGGAARDAAADKYDPLPEVRSAYVHAEDEYAFELLERFIDAHHDVCDALYRITRSGTVACRDAELASDPAFLAAWHALRVPYVYHPADTPHVRWHRISLPPRVPSAWQMLSAVLPAERVPPAFDDVVAAFREAGDPAPPPAPPYKLPVHVPTTAREKRDIRMRALGKLVNLQIYTQAEQEERAAKKVAKAAAEAAAAAEKAARESHSAALCAWVQRMRVAWQPAADEGEGEDEEESLLLPGLPALPPLAGHAVFWATLYSLDTLEKLRKVAPTRPECVDYLQLAVQRRLTAYLPLATWMVAHPAELDDIALPYAVLRPGAALEYRCGVQRWRALNAQLRHINFWHQGVENNSSALQVLQKCLPYRSKGRSIAPMTVERCRRDPMFMRFVRDLAQCSLYGLSLLPHAVRFRIPERPDLATEDLCFAPDESRANPRPHFATMLRLHRTFFAGDNHQAVLLAFLDVKDSKLCTYMVREYLVTALRARPGLRETQSLDWATFELSVVRVLRRLRELIDAHVRVDGGAFLPAHVHAQCKVVVASVESDTKLSVRPFAKSTWIQRMITLISAALINLKITALRMREQIGEISAALAAPAGALHATHAAIQQLDTPVLLETLFNYWPGASARALASPDAVTRASVTATRSPAEHAYKQMLAMHKARAAATKAQQRVDDHKEAPTDAAVAKKQRAAVTRAARLATAARTAEGILVRYVSEWVGCGPLPPTELETVDTLTALLLRLVAWKKPHEANAQLRHALHEHRAYLRTEVVLCESDLSAEEKTQLWRQFVGLDPLDRQAFMQWMLPGDTKLQFYHLVELDEQIASNKEFTKVIDLIPLGTLRRIYFATRLRAIMDRVRLLPLPAATTERTERAMRSRRFRLLPGEPMPDRVFHVYLTFCCERVATFATPNGYGHENIIYDGQRQRYTCGARRGKKTRAVSTLGGDQRFQDMQVKVQRKIARRQFREEERIDCSARPPVLCVDLKGYRLLHGGGRNNTVAYQYCPRCARFHRYEAANYTYCGYACRHCRKDLPPLRLESHRCRYCHAPALPTSCALLVDVDDVVQPLKPTWWCRRHVVTSYEGTLPSLDLHLRRIGGRNAAVRSMQRAATPAQRAWHERIIRRQHEALHTRKRHWH